MASPVEVAVVLANRIAKLPCWAELDAEALLTAIREKDAKAAAITKAQLKAVFLALGYDKETLPPGAEEEGEGGGEGGEEEGGEGEGEEGKEGDDAAAAAAAAPPKEPVKPIISEHAEAVFDCLATTVPGATDALPVSHLVTLLQLCKGGFGEATLRFALKAEDAAGLGAVSEAQLWACIQRVANAPLEGPLRNNLRKAWRAAERYVPPEPEPKEEGEEGAEGGEAAAAAEEAAAEAPAEEGGEEGAAEGGAEGEGAGAEGGDGAAAAEGLEEGAAAEGAEGGEGAGGEPTPAPEPAPAPEPEPEPVPEPVRVLIDSFLEKLGEDERLVALLTKEVPVPIEEPEAPAEEEE